MTQPSRDDVPQPTTEAAPAEDGPFNAATAQLVPVAESIRYRRRAQQAERRIAELEQQLGQSESARSAAEGELSAARRRNDLVRLFAARQVADLDAAIVLAEARLADSDPSADLAALADQLLTDKPYLLKDAASPTEAKPRSLPSATQGRRRGDTSAEQLRAAARRAASGKPNDLDAYLRLRRRFV